MIVEHEPRLHDLKTVEDRPGHDREACASIPRFEQSISAPDLTRGPMEKSDRSQRDMFKYLTTEQVNSDCSL